MSLIGVFVMEEVDFVPPPESPPPSPTRSAAADTLRSRASSTSRYYGAECVKSASGSVTIRFSPPTTPSS